MAFHCNAQITIQSSHSLFRLTLQYGADLQEGLPLFTKRMQCAIDLGDANESHDNQTRFGSATQEGSSREPVPVESPTASDTITTNTNTDSSCIKIRKCTGTVHQVDHNYCSRYPGRKLTAHNTVIQKTKTGTRHL
jgi:hypothetical protein